MLNIYNLYITRSKYELSYLYKLLQFLSYIELNNTLVTIVHINFKYSDDVPNIKFNNKRMIANVYNFGTTFNKTEVVIYNLNDLIKLYNKPKPGKVIFVYTGHSDGMYLIKKKVRLLRIEDFCELVYQVNDSQKADLIIFDCCLCGNIGALYVCYPFTNYVIASTSYQSYLSMLQTQNLYRSDKDFKDIIKEIGSLEKVDTEAYDTNYSLYEMNEHFLTFVNLTLNYKCQFNYNKSYVIDSAKYKDIECCFKELCINVTPLLNKFVLFNRYHKTKCGNRKLNKKKDYSIPSKLMIVMKRPIKTNLPTKADIFLK